jgi:hypothetical protein
MTCPARVTNGGSFSSPGEALTLQNLGRHPLLVIASWLTNPRDLAALACTCKELHAAATDDTLWQQLLSRDYGVHVAMPGGVPSHVIGVYKALRQGCAEGQVCVSIAGNGCRHVRPQIHGDPSSQAVRFVGSSTDGGMDDKTTAYWCDHMFLLGGWAVYSSRTGANVHCTGLLKVSCRNGNASDCTRGSRGPSTCIRSVVVLKADAECDTVASQVLVVVAVIDA